MILYSHDTGKELKACIDIMYGLPVVVLSNSKVRLQIEDAGKYELVTASSSEIMFLCEGGYQCLFRFSRKGENEKMNQLLRKHIAMHILAECPIAGIDDHYKIAIAICNGAPWGEINKIPELDRWPETHMYLHNFFENERI